MGVLKEGTRAPDFSLSDKEGKMHRRGALPGKYIVIFFYPKDNTPGCTIEAKSFSEMIPKFEKAEATLIGISGGDAKSKTKFCEAHSLDVLLLSDPEFKVAKAYGVYGEKKFMGRSYLGILRTTYVVSKKGHIVRVFESVKPENHAQEVLAWLKSESPSIKTPKRKVTKKQPVPVLKISSSKRSHSNLKK